MCRVSIWAFCASLKKRENQFYFETCLIIINVLYINFFNDAQFGRNRIIYIFDV
jgi:hypothetical protein